MAEINGYTMENGSFTYNNIEGENYKIFEGEIYKEGKLVLIGRKIYGPKGLPETKIDHIEKEYLPEMEETALLFEESIPNLALSKNSSSSGAKKLFMFLYDVFNIQKAFENKGFDYFYIYKVNESSIIIKGAKAEEKNKVKEEIKKFLSTKNISFDEKFLTGIRDFTF